MCGVVVAVAGGGGHGGQTDALQQARDNNQLEEGEQQRMASSKWMQQQQQLKKEATLLILSSDASTLPQWPEHELAHSTTLSALAALCCYWFGICTTGPVYGSRSTLNCDSSRTMSRVWIWS
jgi:hypothetical protein